MLGDELSCTETDNGQIDSLLSALEETLEEENSLAELGEETTTLLKDYLCPTKPGSFHESMGYKLYKSFPEKFTFSKTSDTEPHTAPHTETDSRGQPSQPSNQGQYWHQGSSDACQPSHPSNQGGQYGSSSASQSANQGLQRSSKSGYSSQLSSDTGYGSQVSLGASCPSQPPNQDKYGHPGSMGAAQPSQPPKQGPVHQGSSGTDQPANQSQMTGKGSEPLRLKQHAKLHLSLPTHQDTSSDNDEADSVESPSYFSRQDPAASLNLKRRDKPYKQKRRRTAPIFSTHYEVPPQHTHFRSHTLHHPSPYFPSPYYPAYYYPPPPPIPMPMPAPVHPGISPAYSVPATGSPRHQVPELRRLVSDPPNYTSQVYIMMCDISNTCMTMHVTITHEVKVDQESFFCSHKEGDFPTML